MSYGAVPLELYLQTGEERYKTLGMMYADSQWELPANWKLKEGEERQSSMYGDFKDADILPTGTKRNGPTKVIPGKLVFGWTICI